jgi:hypothetical protein
MRDVRWEWLVAASTVPTETPMSWAMARRLWSPCLFLSASDSLISPFLVPWLPLPGSRLRVTLPTPQGIGKGVLPTGG